MAERPLSSIFLFPTYQTREAYEKATGKPCPPWNPEKAPKYWEDPAAAFAARKLVSYDSVLMLSENGTILRETEDGTAPRLEELVLFREEAAVVNIPVKTKDGLVISTQPLKPEIQVPLRALGTNEVLGFQFGGNVVVKDKNTGSTPATGGGSFTEDDRQLLKFIAKKLGLPA